MAPRSLSVLEVVFSNALILLFVLLFLKSKLKLLSTSLQGHKLNLKLRLVCVLEDPRFLTAGEGVTATQSQPCCCKHNMNCGLLITCTTTNRQYLFDNFCWISFSPSSSTFSRCVLKEWQGNVYPLKQSIKPSQTVFTAATHGRRTGKPESLSGLTHFVERSNRSLLP